MRGGEARGKGKGAGGGGVQLKEMVVFPLEDTFSYSLLTICLKIYKILFNLKVVPMNN